MSVQLIPSMDLLGGRIVRLRHGDRTQVTYYEHTPEAWIEQLARAGATRIHLVDLDGAFGEASQSGFASFPSRHPNIQFQLGGGLRSREAIARVIDAGFDAVVGTLAVERPRELAGLANQKVIAALDMKDKRIVTRGWTAPSECESTDVFEALLSLGFSRALVTDVGRDGTMEGPGLDATAWVAREGFQVQASGGLRDLNDLKTLRDLPNVVGAISGKALLDGAISLDDPALKAALQGVSDA
jgi:phosphoribosylformimino-5-aminoimidazole carboxamide ribotide isomerase